MEDCIKNSEPQRDLKLSPEAQLKVKAALDALPAERRDKIKAVLITGDHTPEEIEAHLATLTPEHRESVIVVDMDYDWQCPDLRLPGPANTNRHCTGRHVEGSCTAKGYKAPDKIGRNTLCPCHLGKKYKHCKLKGVCNA